MNAGIHRFHRQCRLYANHGFQCDDDDSMELGKSTNTPKRELVIIIIIFVFVFFSFFNSWSFNLFLVFFFLSVSVTLIPDCLCVGYSLQKSRNAVKCKPVFGW